MILYLDVFSGWFIKIAPSLFQSYDTFMFHEFFG